MAFHDDAYTSEGDESRMTDAEKLAAIERLARQNNNPGVNIGAHRLANQVLAIIEAKRKEPV